MPQSIVVQVGQCGNQIGGRFWDMVLQEHGRHNKKGLYDESMGTFFRNVNPRNGQQNISSGNGTVPIYSLRARSVLIDMEEKVINQMLRSPIGELFDEDQLVMSNSGSGNNWSVGYSIYGPQYQDDIVEAVRRQAEYCDALGSFFVIKSMGGGTGSGLGSYVCETLEDAFPEVHRFVAAVSPSGDDHVVTSPYNSILSLSRLINSADCVMPFENQALIDIYDRIMKQSTETSGVGGVPRVSSRFELRRKGSALIDGGDGERGKGVEVSKGILKPQPFDIMNNIVAHLLMNMTSSCRFPGTMNVDIGDITTNLVPFPRLKFLLSSMAPLYALADVGMVPRRLDQMFSDVFQRECQLMRAEPWNSTYLCCALIARGDVEISDLRKNIDRIRPTLSFPGWNQEAWKTGICSLPPIGQPYSLLSLANNCAIRKPFSELKSRFTKLYKRKANLHHYLENMELDDFQQSIENVTALIQEYNSHDISKQELSSKPDPSVRISNKNSLAFANQHSSISGLRRSMSVIGGRSTSSNTVSPSTTNRFSVPSMSSTSQTVAANNGQPPDVRAKNEVKRMNRRAIHSKTLKVYASAPDLSSLRAFGGFDETILPRTVRPEEQSQKNATGLGERSNARPKERFDDYTHKNDRPQLPPYPATSRLHSDDQQRGLRQKQTHGPSRSTDWYDPSRIANSTNGARNSTTTPQQREKPLANSDNSGIESHNDGKFRSQVHLTDVTDSVNLGICSTDSAEYTTVNNQQISKPKTISNTVTASHNGIPSSKHQQSERGHPLRSTRASFSGFMDNTTNIGEEHQAKQRILLRQMTAKLRSSRLDVSSQKYDEPKLARNEDARQPRGQQEPTRKIEKKEVTRDGHRKSGHHPYQDQKVASLREVEKLERVLKMLEEYQARLEV
ncbi:Tubulin/FtsZ family, GTPase domain-containing protein [Cladochytrium replicatum]|nr:Tubulin/FtsZ family, GTPase domain-containing protein [Cladochytrium replicatum]